MSKILKNTTSSNIEIKTFGTTIPSNGQLVINNQDYLLLADPDTVSELTVYINSGDVVVNDGINDLVSTEAINFLKYPDEALNSRFLSNPEKNNGFTSKNIQEAIEEAKNEGHVFNRYDCGIFRTNRSFYAYLNSGGQTINTTPVTIIVDTISPDTDSSEYLLSSGELQFLYSDTVNIDYTVTYDNTNGTRSSTLSWLEINKGSGFNKIDASEVYTYERNTINGKQSGSRSITINVSNGDIIRIRANTVNASNNVTINHGSSINIHPYTPKTTEPSLYVDGSNLDNLIQLGKIDSGEI